LINFTLENTTISFSRVSKPISITQLSIMKLPLILFVCLLLKLTHQQTSPDPYSAYCMAADRKGTCSPSNTDKPTIGFSQTGRYEDFESACLACKNSKIKNYYFLQTCENTDYFWQNCQSVTPVCGRLNEGGFTQFSDACSACKSGAIKDFYQGNCPSGEFPKGYITCKPTPTREPIPCSSMTEPVCAFLYDGSNQAYKTDCYACAFSVVRGYTRGMCNEAQLANKPAVGSIAASFTKCDLW